MGIKSLLFNSCILCAAFLLWALPVSAAEILPPLNEKLFYEARFLGLKIGEIGIEINQQPNSANIICEIRSAGIAGLFLKHSSHTVFTGTGLSGTGLSGTGTDFSYPDHKYESHYQTRGKARAVTLVYKAGNIVEEKIEPPENKDKRPPVPTAQKNTAYDLMSFLLKMRVEIFRARAAGNTHFTIDAYDGRRLTQADFNIIGKQTIKISGKKYPTIAVTARRSFKAGYSKAEMAEYDPTEPKMTIYFSDDEKLIPLSLEVPFLLQKVYTRLVKQCNEAESCLLGIKE